LPCSFSLSQFVVFKLSLGVVVVFIDCGFVRLLVYGFCLACSPFFVSECYNAVNEYGEADDAEDDLEGESRCPGMSVLSSVEGVE
jgi:hypothetical protein